MPTPRPKSPDGLVVVTGNEDAAKAMMPPTPPPTPPSHGAGAATPVPADVPTAAGSRVDPSIAPSTVKCKSCGAMNRPTEWYCEKCGAELSAF